MGGIRVKGSLGSGVLGSGMVYGMYVSNNAVSRCSANEWKSSQVNVVYIALNHSTDVPEPYPDCSGPGDCVLRGCGCPGDCVLRGCVRGYPCARGERCR